MVTSSCDVTLASWQVLTRYHRPLRTLSSTTAFYDKSYGTDVHVHQPHQCMSAAFFITGGRKIIKKQEHVGLLLLSFITNKISQSHLQA